MENVESSATLRPITDADVTELLEASAEHSTFSESANIARRRLLFHRNAPATKKRKLSRVYDQSPTPDSVTPSKCPPPETIEALYAIPTTPFERSFACRLIGLGARIPDRLIAVDWETASAWMNVMADIREHYVLKHPTRDHAVYPFAPITYTCLQAAHLTQVHDLLGRYFWANIDVSDFVPSPSSPVNEEKYTVVAAYKKLVVGTVLTLPTSPQEIYVAYLVVRAGWDNIGIATNMLYHVLYRNPGKDITLHVSATNPAMLLYNRFGFKAEEFVVGFYGSYMDNSARGSRNAIRLRLRGSE